MNATIIPPGTAVSGPYPSLFTIANDDYHTAPGVSRSGLWKLYTRTPGHFMYGEQEKSDALAFGSLTHAAILQPDELETGFYIGPTDENGVSPRGNTNAWKDAARAAEALGMPLVKAEDMTTALRLRDAVQAHPTVRNYLTGCVMEEAAFWIDEETGVLCRAKGDARNPVERLLFDIKTSANASPQEFARSVGKFGYHVQDPFYRAGYNAAGAPVDGFCFISIEPEPPYAIGLYECDGPAIAEGEAIIRKALATYKRCQELDEWPLYSLEVQPVSPLRYQFTETNPED